MPLSPHNKKILIPHGLGLFRMYCFIDKWSLKKTICSSIQIFLSIGRELHFIFNLSYSGRTFIKTSLLPGGVVVLLIKCKLVRIEKKTISCHIICNKRYASLFFPVHTNTGEFKRSHY